MPLGGAAGRGALGSRSCSRGAAGRGGGCGGRGTAARWAGRGGAPAGSKSRRPLAPRCRGNQHIPAPPLRQPRLAECRSGSARPGGRSLLAAAGAALAGCVPALHGCGRRGTRALDRRAVRHGIRRRHGAPRSPPQVGARPARGGVAGSEPPSCAGAQASGRELHGQARAAGPRLPPWRGGPAWPSSEPSACFGAGVSPARRRTFRSRYRPDVGVLDPSVALALFKIF